MTVRVDEVVRLRAVAEGRGQLVVAREPVLADDVLLAGRVRGAAVERERQHVLEGVGVLDTLGDDVVAQPVPQVDDGTDNRLGRGIR